ncbi:hypothetical protein HUG15_04455 [Salicibibacter cibarius]|uniref:Uncharacterized protein n=1 Tax=Salicibibacter cibarius TaxID=2743000 RepID=A0A7T7CAJ5_9BACI|nr:hypothetical protein HUG15_04455 [Salicibibacter cibarius]
MMTEKACIERIRASWLPHGDRTSDWLSFSVTMNRFMETGESYFLEKNGFRQVLIAEALVLLILSI